MFVLLKRKGESEPMNENRVYCLYRVSTNKQVDYDEQNTADIPMQRKACREFADKMGWRIIREEQENGISGFKVSAENRDKIQLIKEHAEKGLFDILLVFMFDRLGRKSDETPFIVEWLTKKGIKVWSVNEGEQRFESHTDRLTNYIRFWQADGESQKTSIRTRTAMEQMVMEGRWRGGTVPYGYIAVKSGQLNKRKHEVSKLTVHEEEAKVVRQIFNLAATFGYGRWKISNILNKQEIKTRDGKNWHESSVGGILHNRIYIGILRNGKAVSEPFEELRIVDDATFEKVQNQMTERQNINKETRTVPLNVSGQSLLSGNVFCGHCKGRLTLTTNGSKRKHSDGSVVTCKRIRYVCYNKTRKRCECDGQTGYTMHILDEKVIQVLHMIFDKMKSVPQQAIIDHLYSKSMFSLEDELNGAKAEFTKATNEYTSLKAEVVKAVQGESKFDASLLSELVNTAKEKMSTASERLTALNQDYANGQSRLKEMEEKYTRILKWSEVFDESPMEVKKMIANMIIHRVYVYENYRLEFEFNIDFEQFELGLDEVQ